MECGLELHPEKTRIVYCKDKRRKECEHTSFDFLGYTFQPRSAGDRKGEKFLNFLPAISNKAAKESDKPFAHGDLVRRETGVLKNSPS